MNTNDIKKEISESQIYFSKAWADGNKYFELFAKHLPKLDAGKKVLIYEINNLSAIVKIMTACGNADFYVYGNHSINEGLKSIGFKFEEVNNDNEYNIPDMKFDCIIMNPPFAKNLHLKIIVKAIEHLKDDNSKVVNLSPVRWLQDPLAKFKEKSDYNKFEENISKHIDSLEIIDGTYANELFNARIPVPGIYSIRKNRVAVDCYSKYSKDMIFDKVYYFMQDNKPVFDADKKDGWRVRVPTILGCAEKEGMLNTLGKLFVFFDGKKDGKYWYEFWQRNQCSKTTETITNSIRFDNETQANNFVNQFNCKFAKYITNIAKSDVNIAPEKVLWMNNAINPRTGKKGYESEWTDEDFYKFFNLTADEIKYIEDMMAQYK